MTEKLVEADKAARPARSRFRFQRADFVALGVVAAAISASLIIQATSIQIDAARDGRPLDWRAVWILEGSSHAVWLVLATLVPFALNLSPLVSFSIRVVATHLLAAIALSLLHVAGMFALREALFPALLGRAYELDFFSVQTLGYELRKDAFSYCLLLLGFWSIRMAHGRVAPPPPNQEGRITLQCGKRTIFLDAEEIIFAKSAGNYVEVATAAKTHLARMTLAQLESALASVSASHLRVHRSYIVNIGEVREISPTGEGGVVIALKSGVSIPASRTYRDSLESELARRTPVS